MWNLKGLSTGKGCVRCIEWLVDILVCVCVWLLLQVQPTCRSAVLAERVLLQGMLKDLRSVLVSLALLWLPFACFEVVCFTLERRCSVLVCNLRRTPLSSFFVGRRRLCPAKRAVRGCLSCAQPSACTYDWRCTSMLW